MNIYYQQVKPHSSDSAPMGPTPRRGHPWGASQSMGPRITCSLAHVFAHEEILVVQAELELGEDGIDGQADAFEVEDHLESIMRESIVPHIDESGLGNLIAIDGIRIEHLLEHVRLGEDGDLLIGSEGNVLDGFILADLVKREIIDIIIISGIPESRIEIGVLVSSSTTGGIGRIRTTDHLDSDLDTTYLVLIIKGGKLAVGGNIGERELRAGWQFLDISTRNVRSECTIHVRPSGRNIK